MAFNILMFIPIVRIPRSYFKDDIPFSVKVTGSDTEIVVGLGVERVVREK